MLPGLCVPGICVLFCCVEAGDALARAHVSDTPLPGTLDEIPGVLCLKVCDNGNQECLNK